jgi:hypothetical protein
MMDFENIAIHQVVSQKSDFHGKSDFQNSQKLSLSQKPPKKFRPKYASLSKIFGGKSLTHGALQK